MRISAQNLPIKGIAFSRVREALNAIGYYVYALSETTIDAQKTPFYIGKGKGTRCLEHLDVAKQANDEKREKIRECLERGTLLVEILRHDLQSERTARLIESTCIDLFGVDQLTNAVRGLGKDMGRMPLSEIVAIHSQKKVKVLPEHKGLAFLLNDLPMSGISDTFLYERTRGVWSKIPESKEPKFAYATYAGIVKEVYEIHTWVPAGTQQYFTRDNQELRTRENRKEFVGRIALPEVRDRYVGNMIEKERSYGTPFVLVGY